MSFSDRTMTEPYTSREVSTVPGEGDANLLLQDSKAAAPYSTRKKQLEAVTILTYSRPTLPPLGMKQRIYCRIYRAATSECFSLRSLW